MQTIKLASAKCERQSDNAQSTGRYANVLSSGKANSATGEHKWHSELLLVFTAASTSPPTLENVGTSVSLARASGEP